LDAVFKDKCPQSDLKLEMNELSTKLNQLRDSFRKFESCAVAFSGGVDSTLVLQVAHEVLDQRAIAVTALSESLPSGELEQARELADKIGARHVVLRTFETRDENYLANAANRCYFCKTEMYARIKEFAARESLAAVLDGLNQDDLSDRRPGRAAAVEHGVISPLVEANLTKREVRALSQELGLPTWDKPALACLSSRIPHGTPITLQALTQVDRAEMFLRQLGVHQVRVRHHGSVARIEVEPRDFQLVRSREAAIAAHLGSLGFANVELDPEGYRNGNLRTLPVNI
jgi:pyridinium-3,5-biscarboxylic acid mononucleotide sulfurtransferase